MPGSYRVTVEKDYLIFASGHFITYEGKCEPLHGHNYRVRVELEGSLGPDAYVFDFVTLKKIMRELVNELDHRLLLPLNNPELRVTEEGRSVRIVYRDEERVYLIPREDVVLLSIPNTTAEQLATHLTKRLKEELASREAGNLTSILMEVEEAFGQRASYREELNPAS